MEKKNLGPVNALYPLPSVLVGTEVEGKVNYINIAHVGIIDLETLSVSMAKSHYSDQGIKENRSLSINFPTEDMVVEADYVGMVSGRQVDKSEVFTNFYGELEAAPMIKESPLCMECEVIDIIDRPNHDVFLVQPVNTYGDQEILTNGEIDISKVNPILFDMPLKNYWQLGEKVADCWTVGEEYNRE